MLGSDFLQQLNEQQFPDDEVVIDRAATIDLASLFQTFQKNSMADQLNRATLLVDGGIDQGGTTITLESNVINLPLRYINQLKKLILSESEYDLSIYLIIEHNRISQSRMKITKVSSLITYLDDHEAVEAKIEQMIMEQLAGILDAE